MSMTSSQIPVAIVAKQPGAFVISELTYDFLALLPAREPLVTRGPRLHDTPEQRQGKVYAPDIPVRVEVEDAALRLAVSFVDDGSLVLAQGELKPLCVWLSNEGAQHVAEVYLVPGREDHVWIGGGASGSTLSAEVMRSSNSLVADDPFQIPLGGAGLAPGAQTTVNIHLHAGLTAGDASLSWVFVYRAVIVPLVRRHLACSWRLLPGGRV
jgi:hypothetical protein